MNFERVIDTRATKTIYRDKNRVYKVFDESYTKVDILNEALNQARIEEVGLNIPKILEVTSINGKWAIVLEYIEGKTLAQLMKDNPERYNEYLELFVDLQIKVHKKNCPLLAKLKDKMNRKIEEADLDAITRYELHARLEGMPKHNKLCHGDFNPSNIIITANDEAYIIDWSHATIGNASSDVARTYLLFYLAGEIDNANKYLELFCSKSGIEKGYVQKWLPLVAAAQSTKGKKEERDFLLSWVNVID